MKTIEEMINFYVSRGMTSNQAENYVCQEIILNNISKSPLANNVLIKGGVVMFNMTHNLRRTTSDLDFDFIRYDISDSSIRAFVSLLNKTNSSFSITINKIEPLKQEDYKGKRVWTTISDDTRSVKFKLDIGVHTLLAIEQDLCCFYFDDENKITLKVNPPEQIFAEKLYSLAKHGALSTRFKDVFDMYYFINRKMLNRKIVKRCLELLAIKQTNNIKSLEDILGNVSSAFDDMQYLTNFETADDKWLEVSPKEMFKTIIDYLYSL